MHLLDLPVPPRPRRDERRECAFLGAVTGGNARAIDTALHHGVAFVVIATLRPDGRYIVTIELARDARECTCTQSLVIDAASLAEAHARGAARAHELIEQFECERGGSDGCANAISVRRMRASAGSNRTALHAPLSSRYA